MPACGSSAWQGASARPGGSGSEAQHGGIGTESSRPCCDRDMRMQPLDVIKRGTSAEFANTPARCGADAVARRRNATLWGRSHAALSEIRLQKLFASCCEGGLTRRVWPCWGLVPDGGPPRELPRHHLLRVGHLREPYNPRRESGYPGSAREEGRARKWGLGESSKPS